MALIWSVVFVGLVVICLGELVNFLKWVTFHTLGSNFRVSMPVLVFVCVYGIVYMCVCSGGAINFPNLVTFGGLEPDFSVAVEVYALTTTNDSARHPSNSSDRRSRKVCFYSTETLTCSVIYTRRGCAVVICYMSCFYMSMCGCVLDAGFARQNAEEVQRSACQRLSCFHTAVKHQQWFKHGPHLRLPTLRLRTCDRTCCDVTAWCYTISSKLVCYCRG